MLQNANAVLSEYTGTQFYYKYFMGVKLTDGSRALADEFKCYWLMDVIVSWQLQINSADGDIQVWTLTVNEDKSALVKCTDGNDNLITSQFILYTDFKANTVTLYYQDKVIYLPSEH